MLQKPWLQRADRRTGAKKLVHEVDVSIGQYGSFGCDAGTRAGTSPPPIIGNHNGNWI